MRTPEADTWGIIGAFLIPLLLFVALNIGHSLPEHRVALPPEVPEDACRAIIYAPKCTPFYPENAPPDFQPVELVCSPEDWGWTVPLTLLPEEGQSPDCRFELFVLDNLKTHASIDLRAEAYADSQRDSEQMQCQPHAGGVSCRLSGAPWRRYTVIPVDASTTHPQIAGTPGLLSFLQTDRLNVRPKQGIWFTVSLLMVAGMAGLGYAFRPGGARWTGTGRRWLDIALVGACGGVLTGLLYSTRPADVGGFDVLRSPSQALVIVLSFALTGAVVAATSAFVRPRMILARRSQAALVFPVIAVLSGIVSVFLYVVFTRYGMGQISFGFSFKERYYFYFGVSVILPLFVYREDSLRRLLIRGQGTLKMLPKSWLEDFALCSFGGLISTVIARLAGAFLEIPEMPLSPLVGFYKPNSGMGLWLIVLPLLAALALAVNLGREKAVWIQELDALLGRWGKVRGRQRTTAAIQILTLLQRHEAALPAHLDHLGYCARMIGRMNEVLRPGDLARIARVMGQPPDALAGLLSRVLSVLENAPGSEPIRETPLLLVDTVEGGLYVGKLSVERYPDPNILSGWEQDISHNQRLLPPTLQGRLREGCSNVLAHVLKRELLEAGGGLRWNLLFDYEDVGKKDFKGDSYQLSLALLVWGAQQGSVPLTERWAASCAIALPDSTLQPILHLEIKAQILQTHPLLISHTDTVRALPDADDGVVRVLVPEVVTPSDLDHIRRQVGAHLQRGQRVIVGLSNYRHAVHLLYGDCY